MEIIKKGEQVIAICCNEHDKGLQTLATRLLNEKEFNFILWKTCEKCRQVLRDKHNKENTTFFNDTDK
jgi:hypothetical protein